MISKDYKDYIEKIIKSSRIFNEEGNYEFYNDECDIKENISLKWIELLIKVIEKIDNNQIINIEIEKLLQVTNDIPFKEIFSVFLLVAQEELNRLNPNIFDYFSKSAIMNIKEDFLKSISKISSQSLYVKFCSNNMYYIKKFLGEINDDEHYENSNIEYNNFIKAMLNDGLKDFFLEYAVLTRHIFQGMYYWIDFVSKLIQALEDNYKKICSIFFNNNIVGKVIQAEFSLSDNHNNNQTVVKLTFENQKSIIFKPRDISIESSFYELLKFLNMKCGKTPQRILKILHCETYGWVEFVEHSQCTTIKEVKNYYKRSGALLCLIYVLSGSDFHLQNLIASGETPVLIDLEMLMTNNRIPSGIDLVLKKEGSVLYTGLLPIFYKKRDGSISDLSGFGSNVDIETTFKEPIWKNINTDQMYIEFNNINNLSYKNVVKINGKIISPSDFVNEIIDGFSEMYNTLINIRKELIEENIIVNLFSKQSLRFIFRDTQDYHNIINSLLSPNFLHSGVEWIQQCERIFSKLYTRYELNSQILKYEYKCVSKLDVPYFSYFFDSRDLYLSESVKINDYFEKTTYEYVNENIISLNKDDMLKQIEAIKISYKMFTSTKNSYEKKCILEKNYEKDFFMKEAKKIAEQIIDNKIESYNSIDWIHLLETNVNTYVPSITDSGLYCGNAGIAIFLAAISKISNRHNYFDIIKKILKPINDSFFNKSCDTLPTMIDIGIASGVGGLIYSNILIGKLLNNDTFYKDTINIVPKITQEIIEQDTILDVMGGSSGLILGLLALYKTTKNEEALFIAIKCGWYLLKNRSNSINGFRAWKHNKISAMDNQPLCGFSHGASGIAYALLKLFECTGIKDFCDSAEEAILYEDSFLLNEMDKWPDLRKTSFDHEKNKLHNAWCHGASGILLTRIEALPFLNTKAIQLDIDRAIHILMNIPSKENSLCCGNYGKVDVLLSASQKLNRPDLEERAIDLIKSDAVLTYNSIQNEFFNLGFFKGVSGKAYSMLRLFNKDEIPSVLAFDI